MVMGIDPGKQGAFAVLDGDSVIVEPMPLTEDGALDLYEIARLFRYYANELTHAYLELQSIRPMQAGQFQVGRGFGNLEGMLSCLRMSYTVLKPQDWSRFYEHGVNEKNIKKRYPLIKKARREIVARLYPGIDLRKSADCRVAHEGMVDALLIADYGMKIKRGTR